MDYEFLIQQLHFLWNLKLNQNNGIPSCTIRVNDFIIEYTNFNIVDGFIYFNFEEYPIGFIAINDIKDIR